MANEREEIPLIPTAILRFSLLQLEQLCSVRLDFALQRALRAECFARPKLAAIECVTFQLGQLQPYGARRVG